MKWLNCLIGKEKKSWVQKKDRIQDKFNGRQVENIVDPSILATKAFKMIKEDYEASIY